VSGRGAESPPEPALPAGRYDALARRLASRRGRERGCHVYIAAEELQRAGWPLDGPPPFYRVWGSSRGGLFIRLYAER
jgi:hypothetical protein